MTIIVIVSFTNIFNFKGIDFEGIFILSIIFLFPLLFFIQGLIAPITNTNIILSLGVSTLNFIVLMMIYLNDSALIYIWVYLTSGIIGYIISKCIMKKSSKCNM